MCRQRRARGFFASEEGRRRLKDAMRAKNLSSRKLLEEAEKLCPGEVSDSKIRYLLSGNPERRVGRDAIETIARVLDLDPRDIVGPAKWDGDFQEQSQQSDESVRSQISENDHKICPYRGLLTFQEEDAPFYFGRERFIEDRLLPAVREKSVVLISGASGTGKSSVVFAGLIPKLRQENDWVIIGANNPPKDLPLRPGHRPFYNLATALTNFLLPEAGETKRMREIKDLSNSLESQELSLTSDVIERIRYKEPGCQRILLVIDQLEELFTICSDSAIRQRYLEQLLQLATDKTDLRVTVILTLRADFFPPIFEYRTLTEALQESIMIVPTMTDEELRSAIEKPAHKVGVDLEPGLVDDILDDIKNQPGSLPLLSDALFQLWEGLDHA
jgi:hypothetical protein